MLRKLLFAIYFIAGTCFAQDKISVSGTILSSVDGETVVGAKVQFPIHKSGVVTNAYGYYSVTIPAGETQMLVSAYGFENEVVTASFTKDTVINFSLKIPAKEITEVVISANRSENVKSADMGQIELKMDEIKKLPAFMGEVDLVKTVQMLPGVSSASEGSQGMYVRGGGPDQNLVLLDEVNVYNASHLFGFFSVFNSDAVKSVNLIKGGMPANFGGRLSSVLEVNMNEGNKKNFSVKGGIGIIASRLSVEGPIKKDRGSFMISGRRTYVDLLMKAFIPKSSPSAGSGYYFYDLNFKANYKITERDHIYISGYFGKDEFRLDNKRDDFKVSMPWQNGVGSIKWTHRFKNKLFMTTSANYTNYKFSFGSSQDMLNLKLASSINDFGGKVDFTYYPSNNRHKVKFGAQYTYHVFMPNSVFAEQDSTIFDTGASQKLRSHETAIYVLDEWDVTENFKINAGLRWSTFTHVGEFTRYFKGDFSNPDSSRYYGKGDVVAFYQGVEPRISMRYAFKDNSSIKLGAAYNYQYVHLASISAVSLPTDIWYPTTDVAKPQKGWQAAIGYFRNFFDDMFESSIEVYYKGMDNLVEFKEGALPTDNVNDNTDNLLTFGKGWSYGVELFFKKRIGKFTGWVGYTWAKTERKFAEINNGNPFPAKYDRRHDINVVGSYEFNKRWLIGASFVYATGNTMTLPNAWYMHNQDLLFHYADRNSVRMAPYHRLDISLTFYDKEFKEKKDPATNEIIQVKKKFRSNWVVSVYNVYSRMNPMFMYISSDGSFNTGDFNVKVKQVSLFPIIPTVTWNFEI